MRETIEIAARYCGPPGSGNGGYAAGLLAARSSGVLAVTVRLRRPLPLETAIEVRRSPGGRAELVHFGETLTTAEPSLLRLEPPAPSSFAEASRLARSFESHGHPVPRCFVCGPERAAGDGLRILPGSRSSTEVVAPWRPDRSLDRGDGLVAPEFVWAALDCPGYFAAVADYRPMVLGQITAQVWPAVRVIEPCVAVGWKIHAEGRRHWVGTAIYGSNGELRGLAESIWVELRATVRATTTFDTPRVSPG